MLSPGGVVIDPGHGGPCAQAAERHDGCARCGTTAGGLREADVVLRIGREIQRALAPLVEWTALTRDGDIAVPLRERADLAARTQARALVSLHVNALPPDSPHLAKGRGAIVCHASRAGRLLALRTIDALVAQLGARRGSGTGGTGLSHRPRLTVLASSPVPAVLLELGYATHPEDAAQLGDEEWGRAAAAVVAGAVAGWLRT